MPDIRMTPGNRAPGRYRKTTLSVAMLALMAAGAGAPQLFDQFLGEKEGDRLVAYKDGDGIWTICRGLTRIDGIRVKQGDRLTPAQCDFYNREHTDEAMREMAKRFPQQWPHLSEPAKVGIASFCWTNIGWSKCDASSFARDFRAGAPANVYCSHITKWIFDGGRDCRRAGSNCQGQPIRRMQEDELCLVPKEQP
jgi:lysozyme